MRRNLFWLSDDQWRRIEPHLPTDVRGKERVDGRSQPPRACYAADRTSLARGMAPIAERRSPARNNVPQYN
jgi:transposase